LNFISEFWFRGFTDNQNGGAELKVNTKIRKCHWQGLTRPLPSQSGGNADPARKILIFMDNRLGGCALAVIEAMLAEACVGQAVGRGGKKMEKTNTVMLTLI
jgi:hypothetical protein